VNVRPAAELDRGWRNGHARSVVDRRYDDGRPFMTIDWQEKAGYRIWAPGHGRYVVSNDGRDLRCALPARTRRWERLFNAQALPLAAALQGLELFHASAVSIDGAVCAFVGTSGTGKTSVALQLVAAGAALVTDDVLALEPGDDGVRAFNGIGVACVTPEEHERAGGVGAVVGRTDKLHVALPLEERSLPLRSLHYIERDAAVDAIRVERVEPVRPDFLLGSSFISYVDSDRYLLDHLEACARIASAVSVFWVAVPTNATAADVARAVSKAAAA
jgi:hypothetical protein